MRLREVGCARASGDEKLLTKCHHESTGPPLKSFLFDVPAGEDSYGVYAKQTARAIDHVKATFPGLRSARAAIHCSLPPLWLSASRCWQA